MHKPWEVAVFVHVLLLQLENLLRRILLLIPESTSNGECVHSMVHFYWIFHRCILCCYFFLEKMTCFYLFIYVSVCLLSDFHEFFYKFSEYLVRDGTWDKSHCIFV